MSSDITNKKVLVWKSKRGEIKIKSLKELFDVLTGISQENIDSEIKENVIKQERLVKWIESNFPNKLELISHIKTESKEFTPQQIRERLIRDLHKVLGKNYLVGISTKL